LLQSREKLRAGYGVFFPLVGGNFGSAREKFLPAQFGSAAPGSIFNFFTASASVSYALDVFGGERRSLENLAALAEYQKFVAAATYMTLLGNIVNAVVAGAAYRAEIEAVEEILRFEKEQLEISETQARAGIVPYANVTAIRAQVAATEAMLPPLRKSLDQALHLTAALAGRLPAQWTVQPVELADLALPADIPLSVPSELVRRRPDILAAEAQMHAALASVGVATAALFPSLTLDASFGQGSTNISQLLQKAANFWSIGASLATPALEGATLWYQRRAALRGYEASVANYEETVVGAFQQVADALRAVERDAETVQADSDALAAAGETLNLVSANHAAGLVNYLQVLTADAQYQQARLNLVGARALRLQDTSALFVALGGGWWSGEGEPDR
jgi:NodT family efflux transporter outer membrane factor (OMF) lipoprotein